MSQAIEISSPQRASIDVSAIRRRSIEITPASSGGGGKVAAGTPFATVKDNKLTLYMVTLQQMENLFVVTSAGMVHFVVTTDSTSFDLKFSSDSPQAIAGQSIIDDSKDMYEENWVLDKIEITFPVGYTIASVALNDIDANLIDEGDAWRLADIQRKVGKVDLTPVAKETQATLNKEEIEESVAQTQDNLAGGVIIKSKIDVFYMVGLLAEHKVKVIADDADISDAIDQPASISIMPVGTIVRYYEDSRTADYEDNLIATGIKPNVTEQDILQAIEDNDCSLGEYVTLVNPAFGFWRVKQVLDLGGNNDVTLYIYEAITDGKTIKDVYNKFGDIAKQGDLLTTKADAYAAKISAGNVAQFFGLPQALPEYTALTPAEAIAIARDCQYNVMGDDWPIPTWLPTGVTEAQVESAAEGLGIPYHEPTQA